jgi:hypothetical protein
LPEFQRNVLEVMRQPLDNGCPCHNPRASSFGSEFLK